MNERPLLIQTHWTDFQSFPQIINNPTLSLVRKAKAYFQRVVLVCADTTENRILEEHAREIGVEYFAGATSDVCLRFQQCMEILDFKQAARALIYWFMVDFDFVMSCFQQLESESRDIVVLPQDLDIKFGADIFSLSFLNKAQKVMDEMNGPLVDEYRFRPWALAEAYPEHFGIAVCQHPPVFGGERFQEIRTAFNQYYPERSASEGSPFSAYNMAASLLNSEVQRVADIACGWGNGSKVLAETFPEVLGVDYSREQIQLNGEKFFGMKNLQFVAGDCMDETLLEEDSLDAIVSIHSMEHFPDDKLFLSHCVKWLKDGGSLVLEVPLLMEYPFKGIDTPLGEKHIREYKLRPLLDLCQTQFDIEQIYGVSRGFYVRPELARNAVLLLLKAR